MNAGPAPRFLIARNQIDSATLMTQFRMEKTMPATSERTSGPSHRATHDNAPAAAFFELEALISSGCDLDTALVIMSADRTLPRRPFLRNALGDKAGFVPMLEKPAARRAS